MKKIKLFICIVLSMTIGMIIPSLTVLAESEKIIPDLGTDTELYQEIENCLQNFQKEITNSVEISVNSIQSENNLNDEGINGYDINKIVKYYTMSPYMVKEYAETKNFSDSIQDNYLYMIPYENETASGVIYLTEEENELAFGSYTIDRNHEPAKELFHMDNINECISELNNITEIKFLRNDMYKMNFVYLVANKEEYIIPYYYAMFADEYQGMEEGQLHSVDSFMKWLSTEFTNHPGMMSKMEEKRRTESGANYFFGGGITYIGEKNRMIQKHIMTSIIFMMITLGFILYLKYNRKNRNKYKK